VSEGCTYEWCCCCVSLTVDGDEREDKAFASEEVTFAVGCSVQSTSPHTSSRWSAVVSFVVCWLLSSPPLHMVSSTSDRPAGGVTRTSGDASRHPNSMQLLITNDGGQLRVYSARRKRGVGTKTSTPLRMPMLPRRGIIPPYQPHSRCCYLELVLEPYRSRYSK
jgi:hypothetical protein